MEQIATAGNSSGIFIKVSIDVLILSFQMPWLKIYSSFHGHFNGIDVPMSSCDILCPGDPLQSCGGTTELRLFSITGKPKSNFDIVVALD